MIIEQIPIGPMANFGYILACEETRIAALIDPAFEPEKLVARAKELELDIEWILNTHGHFDHINGNNVAVEMTGAKIIGHNSSTFHVDNKVDHGDTFAIGNLDIHVLFTPGHSPDEICFFVNNQVLFTGDVLFVGECGRTDLPGSNVQEMYKSLFEVLASVPDDVDIFPGHDYGSSPMSTMGFERGNNYVLKPRSLEDFVVFMNEP
jgi:glyoxylase-like metal-dependent hydrolase (beta-lactamase superfamily II)